MKRVLFLAYFFPPLGGGGCQRTLKLVRYLEPLGYRASVVTASDPEYWILDPTLEDEIPPATEVIRVSGFTAHRVLHWLRRVGGGPQRPQGTRRPGAFRALRALQAFFLVPDGFLGWSRAAGRAAARRIQRGDVDAIWTTSSPESAHLAGLELKRRFGLPWVADFRDPWVGRATYRPPTPFHDRAHRRRERAVLAAADRITMVSEAMIEAYRERYPGLPEERFVFLPNGYDADDFRRAAALTPSSAEAHRTRFLLLHAGQLAHRPTVRTVLDAVQRLREQEPAAAARLRVRFLGGNEEVDPVVLSRSGTGAPLEFLPSVPHLESIAAMRAADALLLLGHGGKGDSLIYTGKIYEYVASGRPILAVLDPGPAADLIRRLDAGAVIRPGDVAAVTTILANWLARWERGERIGAAVPESAHHGLDRREAAARAAAVLSQITG